MMKAPAFYVLLLIGVVLFGYTPAKGPSSHAQADDEDVLGVGIVRPRMLTGARLYFYPTLSDLDFFPDMVTPGDSLVFGAGRHQIPIAYAPPWFAPEYMVLDYDAVLMRAVTVSRYWIEVVVNTSTPRPRMFPHTMWVAREDVEFSFWPEFLLNVAAIEVLDAQASKLHLEPRDDARTLTLPAQPLLRSLAIQGYWLKVGEVDGSDDAPLGWIRWRTDDRLTIAYSLNL